MGITMTVEQYRERQIWADERLLEELHQMRRELVARIDKIQERLEREKQNARGR